MKALLRGIGYFLLYMVFTIVIQVALSVVIVWIAAGMGIAGQTRIEDFANKNILGMTIVSGLLTWSGMCVKCHIFGCFDLYIQ